MRIIEYPPAEPELEVRCSHCKALLGYTESECFWEDSYFSSKKYIKCLHCKQKITLANIPYPIVAGQKTYDFFSESQAKEAN